MIHTSCETLPMWCFFKVSQDYRYLQKRKKEGSIEDAYSNLTGNVNFEYSDAWENILLEFAKLNKDYGVEDVFDKSLAIKKLEAEYNSIMTIITYLSIDQESEFAKECIEDLKNRGYRIDQETREKFLKSLKGIRIKAGVILTRINLISLQIRNVKSNETQGSTFDDIVVWIHSELGVMPDEWFTVRRFISYKEQISKKINGRHQRERHTRQ